MLKLDYVILRVKYCVRVLQYCLVYYEFRREKTYFKKVAGLKGRATTPPRVAILLHARGFSHER